MATLRDVAEQASVSVATASRVLNGSKPNHPVSSEVRAAVRAAAESLGYMPSAAAQALQQQRSKIIGVIASDILDPYFAEMTRGIEIEASGQGFVTMLANANRDPAQESTKFRVLREHQASGIVFCGSDIDGAPGTARLAREVTAAARHGTKVVALAPRGFEATKIVVDNAATAYDLTSYLLSLGHRDIAFVGGIPGLTAAEQRITGFQAAMVERGLTPRPPIANGMSQESGRDAISRLLAGSDLPNAVICTNDEVAVGALAYLWRRGLRVPEDISVAGIGGTRAATTFDMTTMTLPLMELGRLAARHIVATETDTEVPEPPPCTLRVGSTTAPRDMGGGPKQK